MNKDRINEMLSVALGSMSVIAIIGILVKNDFETNEVLGSIVNFTQVGIPVLVLLITARMNRKSKSLISEGREALEKLRDKYNEYLQGPQFEHTDYDPEEEVKSHKKQYLFFKKDKYREKVAFVPLEPIERGILDIRVSKATFVNFGFDAKDPKTEALFKEVQNEIYSEFEKFLLKKYKGLHEILNKKESETRVKYDNSAIVIDFDQDKLKLKGLKKAVYICSEKAFKIILSYKIKHDLLSQINP